MLALKGKNFLKIRYGVGFLDVHYLFMGGGWIFRSGGVSSFFSFYMVLCCIDQPPLQGCLFWEPVRFESPTAVQLFQPMVPMQVYL